MRVTPKTLEVERPSEPFEVEMDDGNVYPFKHTNALPLEQLVSFPFMSPLDRLKAMLAKDSDFDAFAKSTFGGAPIDGFFLDAILPAYYEHYGMGSPGESAASSA